MGLMSFIKSQLIDIIEWLDDTNYTLVWRFPDQDHEVKNGAKLICRPGQAAVLVNEGSAVALLPALRRGELHLVVGRVSSDVPAEGLDFEAFYSEPMQVVARVGHPIARRSHRHLPSGRAADQRTQRVVPSAEEHRDGDRRSPTTPPRTCTRRWPGRWGWTASASSPRRRT